MCTAAVYRTKGLYFGRNLDYERGFGERIAITPRLFPFSMRHMSASDGRYALIGMAHIAQDFPLYYDAMNEAGLCMAGLNFVGNAVYRAPLPDKHNVAQFELIPWLLRQCATVAEARPLLAQLNITGDPFCEGMPTAQLHWMIADAHDCIVLESDANGVHIYDDPAGVLTNNPPFPMQLFALNNYQSLSAAPPQNRFGGELPLAEYSRGMGAIGLPGDLSSQSRFVRAAFVRANSVSGSGETESVTQFFHILGSVAQQRGCCRLADGACEYTIYSSCCSAATKTYYYITYNNPQISAVCLRPEDASGTSLISFPMETETQIRQIH